MSITEQSIQTALKEVVDPNTGKDLVTSRSVKNIKITGSDVALDVELGYPAKSQIEGLRTAVIAQVVARRRIHDANMGVRLRDAQRVGNVDAVKRMLDRRRAQGP